MVESSPDNSRNDRDRRAVIDPMLIRAAEYALDEGIPVSDLHYLDLLAGYAQQNHCMSSKATIDVVNQHLEALKNGSAERLYSNE